MMRFVTIIKVHRRKQSTVVSRHSPVEDGSARCCRCHLSSRRRVSLHHSSSRHVMVDVVAVLVVDCEVSSTFAASTWIQVVVVQATLSLLNMHCQLSPERSMKPTNWTVRPNRNAAQMISVCEMESRSISPKHTEKCCLILLPTLRRHVIECVWFPLNAHSSANLSHTSLSCSSSKLIRARNFFLCFLGVCARCSLTRKSAWIIFYERISSMMEIYSHIKSNYLSFTECLYFARAKACLLSRSHDIHITILNFFLSSVPERRKKKHPKIVLFRASWNSIVRRELWKWMKRSCCCLRISRHKLSAWKTHCHFLASLAR